MPIQEYMILMKVKLFTYVCCIDGTNKWLPGIITTKQGHTYIQCNSDNPVASPMPH